MTTHQFTQYQPPTAANAHATEIGGRTVQQDAATFRTRSAPGACYLIAAIADGLGSAKGSEYVARAAVEAVCALGEAADYGYCPEELLPLAAAVLPLHIPTAESAAGIAFSGFADGPGYGYRPDTTIAVVTIDDDADINVGWLGDCRVWVEVTDGRLIQLTDDHNMARIGRPNVVTRTLGKPGEGFQHANWHHAGRPDWWPVRVLLTTDGVHGAIPARAIHYALTTAPNAQRAAIWLTRWAVRAAGRDAADNATALLFEIASAESHRIRAAESAHGRPEDQAADQAKAPAPF
ncbi:PP2C family protein-serine/threonine phosphatase [Nocardia salmonicida]|uniref:PP2C family protein-serine/threonine phosphatase n=1 Tax=Nocardia salmonicida TaxID=53431 RepID=UPI0033E0DDF2